MAIRRKPARKKAAKKPAKRAGKSRTVNEILIDLGRQALADGVREVLVDHGIDSSVKVELALTKRKGVRKPVARKKAAKKATARKSRY